MSEDKSLKKERERRDKRLKHSFQRIFEANRVDNVEEFIFDIVDRIIVLGRIHQPDAAERWRVKKPFPSD